MHLRTISAAVICILLAGAFTMPAFADLKRPLVLSENGQTQYKIVIAEDAPQGEAQAAKELAKYLNQITGAQFPITGDAAPESQFEIVVGDTRRKSRSDVPEELRTDNWEGFTLLRDDVKLYIMGNIPRATLYGVYDFLDVELGVRFLTPEATHVPENPTLTVAMKSRTYGPAIERRTIWEGGNGVVIENRLNGISFGHLGDELGGVKWVGRPTHTFDMLVPSEKYFDEHPEYYSEIKGKRLREYDGLITQLCMTNPDVLKIATDTARAWLGSGVKSTPQIKHVISVTVNDSPWFCKCAPCVAMNKEEGVVEGGTKMRFVNAIARTLQEEYGNVSVETMVYGTQLPKKTKAAPNVLIQLVADPDWRFALDDSSHERNRKQLQTFREQKKMLGDGYFYNWVKLGTYGSTSYLDPRPNLRYIARNIRIMNEEGGVRGYFCQAVQSRGTEMQDLRFYLMGRAMWRPHIDSQETIKEFCTLYYGKGAKDVLRYIDFHHDEYGQLETPKPTMANPTIRYDDRFIATADEILAEAEAKAETATIKQRVATCRLPIWKLQLDRAFGETGKIHFFPVEWSFKIDPDDAGLTDKWYQTTSFDDWTTMRIDKHWTMQGEERRGAAWYATTFNLPDTNGAPLALWFGSIDGDADIFIDGEKVAEQKLGASVMWCHGFFRPLPNGLSPGEHTIAIRVFKKNYNAGIWREISIIDMSQPISPELRTAGERFLKVARAADLAFLSESYGGKYTQTDKVYYPKIEFFLKHGQMN